MWPLDKRWYSILPERVALAQSMNSNIYCQTGSPYVSTYDNKYRCFEVHKIVLIRAIAQASSPGASKRHYKTSKARP